MFPDRGANLPRAFRGIQPLTGQARDCEKPSVREIQSSRVERWLEVSFHRLKLTLESRGDEGIKGLP